jgi:hypothetical protein
MEIKVQILTSCEACNGQAYLPAGEAISYSGERYKRYEPCCSCQGSGRQTRWIRLDEFASLLANETVSSETSQLEAAMQALLTLHSEDH